MAAPSGLDTKNESIAIDPALDINRRQGKKRRSAHAAVLPSATRDPDGQGGALPIDRGALPDWLSEPEVIVAGAPAIEDLPVFAYVEADVVTALMALKPHPPGAVEIALIATRPEYHGRGAGRHLVDAAERFGHESGARLLTVKTLAPRGRDEPQFEATRRFYERNGFVRAEVFAKLWHEGHPCLFMVKPLAGVQVGEATL